MSKILDAKMQATDERCDFCREPKICATLEVWSKSEGDGENARTDWEIIYVCKDCLRKAINLLEEEEQ